MPETIERIRPHKDMTAEQLRGWRTQQAGDHAYARNQRRPGWTQRRASNWYGVSKRQWERYESGECRIPLSLVKRMIAYEASFDQTVDRIFNTSAPQLEEFGGVVPELQGRD
jgi:hypothetical protein